jgi:double-stranded uracil-DNA glycosylase
VVKRAGNGSGSPTRHRGLAPIIAADARVLILGSFPSEASLAAQQYYAHPRNHFWPIVGEVLHEPLAQLPYTERISRLKAHRVAIWDTIVACERSGSLDAAIRNAEQGEIHRVRRIARGLRAVCFNGKTAALARSAWAHAGYATLVMPSTSPAYTLPIGEKLASWRELARFLDAQ